LANITRESVLTIPPWNRDGTFGQKNSLRAELPDAVGIRKKQWPAQMRSAAETKFNGVCATIDECVVVHLERIPVIQYVGSPPTPPPKETRRRRLDLSSSRPANEAERIVGGHGINCLRLWLFAYGFVVLNPKRNGIDEGRREAVGFFDGNNLSGAGAAEEDVIHSVGEEYGSIVEVGSEYASLSLNWVDARGNIFVDHLLTGESK